jgi:monofunctional biosynthetic peptidoglycan transglycosylase
MKWRYGEAVLKVFLIFSISIFIFGAKEGTMTDNERKVIDFAKSSDTNNWIVINDVVMGGVSESSYQVTESGTAVFSGAVSLENNGGFASANRNPSQFDLSDSDGIRFKVKGDGKKYKISVKNDGSFNGFSYRVEFNTKDGEWLTIDAPFSSFIPMLMGQKTSASPIDRAIIKTFGFLISDKQEGPFRLEIDWIGAYSTK